MEQDSVTLSRHSLAQKHLPSTKMQCCFKAKNRNQFGGPVGRNPYLNFLREFRRRNHGLSPVETICRGAKEWNNLPKETKLQYIEAAFYAPKRRRPCLPLDAGCGVCPPPRKKKAKCARRKKKKKSKCGRKKRARCGKKKRAKRRGCKQRKRKRC